MITIVKNTFQKEGVGEINSPASHKFFMDIIKNPIKSEAKKTQIAMIFSEFKKPYRERLINNIKEVEDNYFGLDIDSGISITDFVSQYKNYKFYLYTTASHTKIHNKFRVVFKGTPPKYNFMENEDRRLFRKTMTTEFPFIDKAALGPERLLYLPTLKNDYFYFYNDGEDYKFKNDINIIRKEQHRLNKINNNNAILTKYLNRNNKPKTFKTIDTMGLWIKCNNSGCVQDFINNYSSSCYTSGGANLLYDVLCSAKALEVDPILIEEIHNIQRQWDRQNSNMIWDHKYNTAFNTKISSNNSSNTLSRYDVLYKRITDAEANENPYIGFEKDIIEIQQLENQRDTSNELFV